MSGIEFYSQFELKYKPIVSQSYKKGGSVYMTMADLFLYERSFEWKEFLKTEILN